MGRVLIALLALAGAAFAADVTGTWSGSIAMTDGKETRNDTAYFVLKQNGSEITGSVGGDKDRGHQITKGTIEGDQVYLEAALEGGNRIVLRLKLDGDKLAGDYRPEGPQAPAITGKLAVERKK